MQILKATDFELDQIIKHSSIAIREGTNGVVNPDEDKSVRLVHALLGKGCYYLTAKSDNKLLGWILIGPSKDSLTDQRCGFIYELYILKEHRGQGISKQLLKSALNAFNEAGYEEIRLSVFDGNQAIKMYKELGFKTRTITMSLQKKYK